MHICVHVHVYICTCIYVYIRTCICIYVYVCTYGPQPLNSTGRHGYFLKSTCDIELSDLRKI